MVNWQKTKEGCEILSKSQDVTDFIQCMQDTKAKAINRRAALWAVGYIGSSDTGFQFLEKYNALRILIELAENSPNISIRGTCFYCMGMISKVKEGRDTLYSLGWESPSNLNSCISLPKDLKNSSFFKTPSYEYQGSFAKSGQIEYPTNRTELQLEIITAVGHLSNFISAESASRTLKRLKGQNPSEFANPVLHQDIFKLLITYKFRLPVRRFIYEIFNDLASSEESLNSLL